MDGIDRLPEVGGDRRRRDRGREDLDRSRLTFGWESAAILFKEPNLRDLLQEHWEELGIHKGVMKLNPNFARFISMEALGNFRIWAARNADGLLVGYIAWFVQPHLHYQDTSTATEDLFLLHGPYRKGMNGVRLFTTSVAALRDLGVKRIMLHTKVHFQKDRGGLERLFKRLGFTHTDQIWSRHLDETP